MTSRLLCQHNNKIISHLKRLQYLILVQRYSNQSRTDSDLVPDPVKIGGDIGHAWLDVKAGIFGPRDFRMPLPGDIGNAKSFEKYASSDVKKEVPQFSIGYQIDEFPDPKTTSDFLVDVPEDAVLRPPTPPIDEAEFECQVQVCPRILKEDFLRLFPDNPAKHDQFSVITWCQKTTNDMSTWSPAVEEERERLIENFVDSAERVCKILQKDGHFADFIDPTCGRPFFGNYISDTFFETDERFRHLGFRIEDLGCCTVITHRKWGPKIFVGALFTNAPISSSDDIWPETLAY